MTKLHPKPDFNTWSNEELRMLKLKAAMQGKNVLDYIKLLVEKDQPKQTLTTSYCFSCHELSELQPNTVTESVFFTIGDLQKEIKVTEFPAHICSQCGTTTISVGLSAEAESAVEDLVCERINRPAVRPIPERISFNILLNREAIA